MAEIPYDEMRRILGLPDVKAEVLATRARLGLERAAVAVGQAFVEIKPDIERAVVQLKRMAEEFAKATAVQPFWAPNPTRERRK